MPCVHPRILIWAIAAKKKINWDFTTRIIDTRGEKDTLKKCLKKKHFHTQAKEVNVEGKVKWQITGFNDVKYKPNTLEDAAQKFVEGFTNIKATATSCRGSIRESLLGF